MRVALPILSRPFTAAVLISAAVHAAIVLTASDAAPLNDHAGVRAASSLGRALHVALVQRPTGLEPKPGPAVIASPPKPTAAVSRVQRARDTVPKTSGSAVERVADDTSEAASKPTPLTYPILVLPPNDDPHRIGLVRLLLVVSSEGKVANVIVTASTMSQDYIDRVTKGFEEMRFNPAMLRGASHPGWYEVVVNFDFEPQGAMTSIRRSPIT